MAIRIFLIDDHFVVREGLKLIFETEDEYDVIGEAEGGMQALEKLKSCTPDVILLDLNMPDMSGIDVLKKFAQMNSEIPVLVLTTFDDHRYIKEAFELGAKGYLLKDATREEIKRSIDAASRGEVLLKQNITEALLRPLKESKAESVDMGEGDPLLEALTERESEIIKEVADGKTSKAIALNFGISERTVKAHLTKIYEKLSVDSRAKAVAKALALGIINQSDLSD